MDDGLPYGCDGHDVPIDRHADLMLMGRIRIGCAGWAVPRAHRPLFDKGGSLLERYASKMDAAEINSSFYRPHQPRTYARWAASTPANFRFSVKVPKSISHDHALVGTVPLVDQFLGECLHLGDKLGGLLVQLPPGLRFDGRRANAFFRMLRHRLPEQIGIACEPRHPTWFGSKALAIFARHHVNRVAADPVVVRDPHPGVPMLPSNTGRWRYWRLHGSPRMYFSAYSPDFLERLVDPLRKAARSSDVWVIFDNTAHGHALGDAIQLQTLIAAVARPRARMLPNAETLLCGRSGRSGESV